MNNFPFLEVRRMRKENLLDHGCTASQYLNLSPLTPGLLLLFPPLSLEIDLGEIPTPSFATVCVTLGNASSSEPVMS